MFGVENHGSIVLIRPLTSDVRQWLHDHTDPVEGTTDGETQWYGGALVVEPRYVEDLVHGLIAEGFVAQ